MAAEVQEWVEGGGEVAKKVACKKEPLVVTPAADSGNSAVNGSVGTGESVLSVISDTLSEEYSSDSGKGGSDTTITPPDSINGTETVTVTSTPWSVYTPYSGYTAYSKSLGSVMPNHAMTYEFEIHQRDVGRLIGRYGNYVNKIKAATGANIIVKRHSHDQNGWIKICAVEGVSSEIEQAVKMIRDRFPLKKYPKLSLEQVNAQPVLPASNISFIPSNRLNLVEGIENDVCVSCVTDLDHIFVQQQSHPTFPALARLHEDLCGLYEQPNAAPQLVRPFNPGVICVTKIGSQNWVRAEVVSIEEEKDSVTARLVDVGGYVQVPIDELRQIRYDFVTIPFQATECRLANIAPLNEEEGWSEEAINFFKIICQGAVLQAYVIGYTPCGSTTLINLVKLSSNSNTPHINVNDELVTHKYAKWVDELDPHYYYTDSNMVMYSADVDQLSQNMHEWLHFNQEIMTDGAVEYPAAGLSYFTDENLVYPQVENETFAEGLSWNEEAGCQEVAPKEEDVPVKKKVTDDFVNDEVKDEENIQVH